MSNTDFALAESVSTTNVSYFVFVYILVLIYCCFGLAVVCDVYFVPALQKLSITYDLPPDIAGSTLMALGASVPELFASLIGVFVTEDDIGTGSIIGSSCFNLIAVPAACAFVAAASFSRKLKLKPMPVTRNSAFYAVTILVLLLIIKDNKVDIPESIILLLFFVMYMAFMIFSAKYERAKRDSQRQSSYKDSCNSSADSAISPDSYKSSDYSIKTRKINLKTDDDKFSYGTRQSQNYYFAIKQPTDIYSYISSKPMKNLYASDRQLNEKTPLASAASCNTGLNGYTYDGYSSVESLNLYQQQQQQQHQFPLWAARNELDKDTRHQLTHTGNNQQLSSASVRLNLGIAIKNSTCLLKSVDDVVVAVDDNFAAHERRDMDDSSSKIRNPSDQTADDHKESNWVSSKWILIPMFPLTLSMKMLMPGKLRSTFCTIWTFVISMFIIGGLTYISVWMVHSLSQFLGIPEAVAGMTILSWGTGVPELIASIVLIRKTAEADMAISNTIGSNVIDVSFCLSLPW